MPDPVAIGAHVIGDGAPCFVIAEAGVNHDGSVDVALELVAAAAATGADAVKFQTFATDRLVAPSAPSAKYQLDRTGHQDQQAMLRSLELDATAHRALAAAAREHGIEFLSSPFDHASLDLLLDVGVPAVKLGSGELTNEPLLRHARSSGLPLIVSTGMAELDEVDRAVEVLGTADLVLLHCVSAYPAAPADANLAVMASMRERYGVPVGFSDHTTGIATSIAAAALGAAAIEKHLTLDRARHGPDHAASLEPDRFAELVEGCHEATTSVGSPVKHVVPAEQDVRTVARRSIHLIRDVAAGVPLRREDLDVLRPATGMAPRHLDEVVGRTLRRAVEAGTPLEADLLI